MTDESTQQGNTSTEPSDARPDVLFFNGEAMPPNAQVWWTCVEPLHQIPCGNSVGWHDVSELVWGFESVGKIQSCAPALFVYAIQELILHAFEKEDQVRKALETNESSIGAANEVFDTLVYGALQMRSLALIQRKACWIVGDAENDLPELVEELAADSELPIGFPLQPHQREKVSLLKFKLEDQAKRFHQLAQAGRFTKDLRGHFHAIAVPEDSFLRLIF